MGNGTYWVTVFVCLFVCLFQALKTKMSLNYIFKYSVRTAQLYKPVS
jgi:hypothetical protein